MILNELSEYCKQHGKDCSNCASYYECESYSNKVENAPLLKIKKEEDDELDS